jgi:subtilase family serine protease
MQRMLLLLSHTKEQEADVNRLLEEQQDESSSNFHHWLTPKQYGERFGPSTEEIQTVTGWLQSQGFEVARVARGRHVIEFSGTHAQVQAALHTSIHKYVVNGQEHWANASDPKIPAALAPVVSGVVSLHNFGRKASTTFGTNCGAGIFPIDLYVTNPNVNWGCFIGLGPSDFATTYNLKPLWDEGIDGTGQSIAIVAVSNINVQDARNYRMLFGLPPNDPQVILDGPDPGLNSFESEAISDVEMATGIARKATIKLVAAATTNTTFGADLSSEYIVENNLAPVMNQSFDQCELLLGTAGNQFQYTLEQQAAAQGITSIVVASDNGSSDCDYYFVGYTVPATASRGLSVNGLASTPYNIAVGGTDFNDFFSSPLQYWSPTNDPKTRASALSYVPEMAWNGSCASPVFSIFGYSNDPIINCNDASLAPFLDTAGGGGGPSSCTISDGSNLSTCQGGYSKPQWQRGLGVPADGKRDIPDVSLSAGPYFGAVDVAFCEADLGKTCDPSAPFLGLVMGLGGTSEAGPSLAGIMALVNQKTQSRQGNANFVFYRLAAEESAANCNSSNGPASTCIFNDITYGSNAGPCTPGTPNCATEGNLPVGVTTGYPAGVGYDLATGLGTVNAYNLVHGWKSVTFGATSTHLALSPTTVVHGKPVNADIAVTSVEGTPTGQVSLIAINSTFTLNNQSDGDFTLGKNGTVSSATRLLPGGFYTVRAHYGGDGEFAQSDSNQISVAVSPEQSATLVSAFLCGTSLLACGVADGQAAGTLFSSAPYGTYVFLRADVEGKSGFGNATGLVFFSDDDRPIPGNPYHLNTAGSVSYYKPASANTITPNGITTFAPGPHRIRAFYRGDSSFLASASQPVPFNITQAQTQTALQASTATTTAGASVTLTATINTNSYGNAPTGTITFFAGAKQLGPPVSVTSSVDRATGTQGAIAVLTTARLPVGQENVTAAYRGDDNYDQSMSPAVVITVTAR